MNLPLEKQCVSLELAKKLKELGVSQDSLFYWVKNDLSGDYIPTQRRYCSEAEMALSAFTVAELGEMLPKEINNHELQLLKHNKWHYGYCELSTEYRTLQHWDYKEESSTEADARAKLLVYLIENNLLNPKDL